MKRLFVCLTAALILVGCGKPASRENAMHEDVVAPRSTKGNAPLGAQEAASAPLLAFTFNIEIEADPNGISSLLSKHERACRAAGPAICQVTATSTEGQNEGSIAHLQLRAEPGWLSRFRQNLASDVRSVDGRLAKTAMTSEDLTRQIVDADAAIRAKTTLRDRLQALLSTHSGGVKDLLDIERELATVQGALDTAQSELAVMRTRVATSTLDLDYTSMGRVSAAAAFAPLRTALVEFLAHVAVGLAALLILLAYALPFVAVTGAVVWATRLLRRRQRREHGPPL